MSLKKHTCLFFAATLRFALPTVVLSTVATAAVASDAAPDTVTLSDGGMLRGRVLVHTPGEKIVIQIPGEDRPRTVAWSKVVDVERGDAPTEGTISGYTAAPAETPGKTVGSASGVIKLRIQSDDPETLLIEQSGVSSAHTSHGTVVVYHEQTVCRAPCNQVIDGSRGQQFMMVSGGSRSEPFTLNGYSGNVVADVEPGSGGLQWLGAANFSVGVVGMLGGGALLVTGAVLDGPQDDLMLAGGLSLGIGTGMFVTGIVLMATNQTNVTLNPSGNNKDARAPRYWAGEF